MDAFYKLFDRLTEMLPASALRMIRLGALLAWLIAATVVVFFSWQVGSKSVPASGQDLSMAVIREKVAREKNLKNPPPPEISSPEKIIIPDTGEFPQESMPDIPYPIQKRGENPLEGESPEFLEKIPQYKVKEGPVYQGEGADSGFILYPPKEHIPEKDAGVGGVREGSLYRKSKLKEADLLAP